MAGKSVLVTGGTGGIGKATAIGLAALGARAGIIGRQQPRSAPAQTSCRPLRLGRPPCGYERMWVAWRYRKDRTVQVFLETDRLVLRRFTLADVDNLVNLDADPDVMRFVTGGIPTSREEIQNEFLPAFLGYYQRYESFGFWAAVEKATGEFLGWFHFRPRKDAAPGEVELGYRLRKSAWGKGQWPCVKLCRKPAACRNSCVMGQNRFG